MWAVHEQPAGLRLLTRHDTTTAHARVCVRTHHDHDPTPAPPRNNGQKTCDLGLNVRLILNPPQPLPKISVDIVQKCGVVVVCVRVQKVLDSLR